LAQLWSLESWNVKRNYRANRGAPAVIKTFAPLEFTEATPVTPWVTSASLSLVNQPAVAVQGFLMKHDRDAEPAVLKETFLDGVGQFGHFALIFALARVAGVAGLAEVVPLFEGGLGGGWMVSRRRTHCRPGKV
jgi:hypothetical protein